MRGSERTADPTFSGACEPAAMCLIALVNIAWGCGSTPTRLAFVSVGIVGLTMLYREYLFQRQENARLRAYERPWTPADYRDACSRERRWNSALHGTPTPGTGVRGRPSDVPTDADITPGPSRPIASRRRGAALFPTAPGKPTSHSPAG